MNTKKTYSVDVNLVPIRDEILESVLGGIGDEDGITNSCSRMDCSNKTSLT
jgi:hypothetical protein